MFLSAVRGTFAYHRLKLRPEGLYPVPAADSNERSLTAAPFSVGSSSRDTGGSNPRYLASQSFSVYGLATNHRNLCACRAPVDAKLPECDTRAQNLLKSQKSEVIHGSLPSDPTSGGSGTVR